MTAAATTPATAPSGSVAKQTTRDVAEAALNGSCVSNEISAAAAAAEAEASAPVAGTIVAFWDRTLHDHSKVEKFQHSSTPKCAHRLHKRIHSCVFVCMLSEQ